MNIFPSPGDCITVRDPEMGQKTRLSPILPHVFEYFVTVEYSRYCSRVPSSVFSGDFRIVLTTTNLARFTAGAFSLLLSEKPSKFWK